jgi:hypothetical protein
LCRDAEDVLDGGVRAPRRYSYERGEAQRWEQYYYSLKLACKKDRRRFW